MKYLEGAFPGSTDAVGIFTGAIETTQVVAARNKEAMDQLGWNVVYEGTYNPQGEPTWRPFLEPMRNNGVQGLYWVGEPTNLSKLLSEAASLGITFDWVLTDANHYDEQVTSVGDAAERHVRAHRVLPVPRPGRGDRQPRDAAVPRPDRPVRPGRQDREPRRAGSVVVVAVRQGRERVRRRSSRVTACGRRRRRSPSGPAVGSTRRRTCRPAKRRTASRCSRSRAASSSSTTAIEPTDSIYNCDDGNVVDADRRLRDRRQVPEPGVRNRSEAIELFVNTFVNEPGPGRKAGPAVREGAG